MKIDFLRHTVKGLPTFKRLATLHKSCILKLCPLRQAQPDILLNKKRQGLENPRRVV
jgi:hypothetical protein